MKNIKIIIIAVFVVALVLITAAGIWYCKTRFYIPDKNGMEFSAADTITSCRYESGGGMNGELIQGEIYLKDNGEVWLEYHYSYPVGINKEDINFEHQVDFQALTDIREICREYGVLGWGKLKRSDVIVLDGATESVDLIYPDRQYYSFNSGYALPRGGEKIFDEILKIIKQNMPADIQ